MAKKPVPTFHLLAVAKSLEAQNEAVGFLLARIESFIPLAATAKPELLREWIAELGAQSEGVRAIMYPNDED